MPRFRSVHGGRAGPTAVGILVPPGSRTVVVVRPRALAVDLVMVRRRPDAESSAGFFEAPRQAAGFEAQNLGQALVRCAESASGRVEVVPAPQAEGFHVCVELDAFLLIACSRLPGQAYRPVVYQTWEEAQRTADAVSAVLTPPPDANCELYTNMSQFDRPSAVGHRPIADSR